MRRNKYSDIGSIGRSKHVPFLEGETAQQRHGRRLREASKMVEALKAWCALHDAKLLTTNEGHHWRIQHEKFFAEWWPSSAKFVVDRVYHKGLHVHDVEQLVTLLTQLKRRKDDERREESGVEETNI